LELILEPHAPELQPPDFIKAITVGRRFRATVEEDLISVALEWARDMKGRGFAEEFTISPLSLEDVYVRMIGRADALNGDMEPIPTSRN
jgi:hypothetical protein